MLSSDDYRFLSELLRRRSGLSLGAGKEYLLESRLPAVAATFGHASLAALVRALRASPSPALVKSVCDSMTTGETQFFRDGAPFAAIAKALLPAAASRAARERRAVRIWCAACSTGQEPYSIAMTVELNRQALGGTPVEIIASDYSSASLQRARDGVYNQFEVQRGLPIQHLVKFFRPVPPGFQVTPELRASITFRERNLLESFHDLGAFDIVMLRNVLIYFDLPTKREVLERMALQLTEGGALFLGGSETTLGVTEQVTRVISDGAPYYVRVPRGGPVSRCA